MSQVSQNARQNFHMNESLNIIKYKDMVIGMFIKAKKKLDRVI